VIKLSSAGWGGEDTRLVELECLLVSLDGDRDRLFGDSSGKSIFILGWDVFESSEGNFVGAGLFAGSADSGSSSVWVVGFGADSSVGFNPLEGVVHEATLAAVVGLVARDKVLFGEGNKVSAGDLVSTFKRSGGGESPAGSALSLVLDWGDSSLGGPVDGVWSGLVLEAPVDVLGAAKVWVAVDSTNVELGELVPGEVGVLVVSDLVGEVLGVGLLDVGIVLEPSCEAGLLLSSVVVGLSVFGFPCVESLGGSECHFLGGCEGDSAGHHKELGEHDVR